jgi:hypothetical protein
LQLQYDSLAAAVYATVRVYVAAVLDVAAGDHISRVFLHPVPPVLEATRSIVAAFNAALCTALSDALGREGTGSVRRKVVWLSGLEQAWQQQPDLLCFDGAHLSPRYVQHLEAALAARVQAHEADAARCYYSSTPRTRRNSDGLVAVSQGCMASCAVRRSSH